MCSQELYCLHWPSPADRLPKGPNVDAVVVPLSLVAEFLGAQQVDLSIMVGLCIPQKATVASSAATLLIKDCQKHPVAETRFQAHLTSTGRGYQSYP